MLGFVYLCCVAEVAAEENDLAEGRVLLHALRQTDAILFRHADIQQGNVRLTVGFAQVFQQQCGIAEIGDVCRCRSECVPNTFNDSLQQSASSSHITIFSINCITFFCLTQLQKYGHGIITISCFAHTAALVLFCD